MRTLPALLALLVPGTPALQAPASDPEITRAELAHHVGVLTAPEIGGREAGTPGADRAAEYLAGSLAESGLQPGAADGGFVQAIPSMRLVHHAPPRLIVTENSGNRIEAVVGADFSVIVRGEARSTPDLPLHRISEELDVPDEVRPDLALFCRVGPVIHDDQLDPVRFRSLYPRVRDERHVQPVAPRDTVHFLFDRATIGVDEDLWQEGTSHGYEDSTADGVNCVNNLKNFGAPPLFSATATTISSVWTSRPT